ncbi:MAG: sulfotransferase family 2 domain-containing protein [Pirellulales bacterium]|nr:sulfotransferase family 2 domain-containing protein [Pirellulales bacterium]
MNRSGRYRCVFFHVPRTGGSSIASLGWWDRWTGHFPRAAEAPPGDGYYRFAFVRDPWDRFVSLYHYFAAMTPAHRWYRPNARLATAVQRVGSFAEFCRRFDTWPHRDHFHFWPQYRWITDDDGSRLVDFVGRFERLPDDFSHVCRQVGADCVPLPRHNRSPHGPYRQYYDEQSWQIVGDRYRRDVRMFQYDGCPDR